MARLTGTRPPPSIEVVSPDADGDGYLRSEDCDDDDSGIGEWDDSKTWTYEHVSTPSTAPDYDGANGTLNDGADHYYGDGETADAGDGSFEWWIYTDPEILIYLPYDPLNVTSVGAYVSHGIGGGISAPSAMEVYHRSDSSSSWTSLGSTSVTGSIGWKTIDIEMPETGGQLKLLMTHSDQHTIIGELSLEGTCTSE